MYTRIIMLLSGQAAPGGRLEAGPLPAHGPGEDGRLTSQYMKTPCYNI